MHSLGTLTADGPQVHADIAAPDSTANYTVDGGTLVPSTILSYKWGTRVYVPSCKIDWMIRTCVSAKSLRGHVAIAVQGFSREGA